MDGLGLVGEAGRRLSWLGGSSGGLSGSFILLLGDDGVDSGGFWIGLGGELRDGFAREEEDLLIIIPAAAVESLLEVVHRILVFLELIRGGLGGNARDEFFSEVSKAKGGAVVGLVLSGFTEEILEVGGADVLPVAGVVTGEDGEDLLLAGLGADSLEDFLWGIIRILQRRHDLL